MAPGARAAPGTFGEHPCPCLSPSISIPTGAGARPWHSQMPRGTRAEPGTAQTPPQTGQPVLLGGPLARHGALCATLGGQIRLGTPRLLTPNTARGSAACKAVIHGYHHRGETEALRMTCPRAQKVGCRLPPSQGTPTTATPFPAQCPPAAPWGSAPSRSPKAWPLGSRSPSVTPSSPAPKPALTSWVVLAGGHRAAPASGGPGARGALRRAGRSCERQGRKMHGANFA